MESHRKKSVTLIELIIAIILVSVIILGINSIDIFSRYHLISSDRRAKLQNDLSYCLDHITKEASKAIGNEAIFTSGSVVLINPNTTLDIFTDANGNGMRDIAGSAPKDKWIRYWFDSANYQLKYYADCTDATTPSCAGTPEILTKKITAFIPSVDFVTNGNYIDVSITGRWNPASALSPDNPEITMQASVNLPSVSTH
ncbi:MAG: hypothetical protein COX41_06770 [Candidatus Omnitrophica bacterium CG23_combo_of_CG06-09_8_20_14_all_41_10]|uniref:Uncharacterized protein n=1 Tax=Candidatus Sherwoodlollariibacterium unditelluris TaxID=1974757 RepID=A0A2G9YHJ1_9BACT|nr:MAG: hypothetical protein COX41_06770 [Candidatus Omnitrophica bacterium CG23_combo_of_CG06-09_8_20_14_all_41_10]